MRPAEFIAVAPQQAVHKVYTTSHAMQHPKEPHCKCSNGPAIDDIGSLVGIFPDNCELDANNNTENPMPVAVQVSGTVSTKVHFDQAMYPAIGHLVVFNKTNKKLELAQGGQNGANFQLVGRLVAVHEQFHELAHVSLHLSQNFLEVVKTGRLGMPDNPGQEEEA